MYGELLQFDRKAITQFEHGQMIRTCSTKENVWMADKQRKRHLLLVEIKSHKEIPPHTYQNS